VSKETTNTFGIFLTIREPSKDAGKIEQTPKISNYRGFNQTPRGSNNREINASLAVTIKGSRDIHFKTNPVAATEGMKSLVRMIKSKVQESIFRSQDCKMSKTLEED
jgi:hypothetical protein